MRIIVVYDDTGRKSEVIADIIGDKGFADVVVKKRYVEDFYRDKIKKIFPDLIWEKVHSFFEYSELIKKLELFCGTDTKILHCFSNYIISDDEKALLSLKKLEYIDGIYGAISDNRAVCGMFPNAESYISFCKNILSGAKAWDILRGQKDTFEIDGLVDIGIIGNFIQYVTGNFDSRYFNSLKGNEYTLVKSSGNKKR